MPFKKVKKKKISFEETLNKILKQHRQQDRKITEQAYKRKTKQFHINSVFKNSFCDSKNYCILTLTSLIQGIEGTNWFVWKKGKGPDPRYISPKCTPALIQSPT